MGGMLTFYVAGIELLWAEIIIKIFPISI